MTARVINIADVEFQDWGHGGKFAAKLGMVGPRIGAQKLGCTVTVVPPGKRAFPFHNHRVNEEMFFVIEGEGEIRIGAERRSIRPGDIIACPPGGPETARQILNTSTTASLKYLALSTKVSPEFVDYPDSGKFGIRLDTGVNPDGTPIVFRHVGRMGPSVDYWEGEGD